MLAGGILYALGLVGMGLSTDALNFTLAGGLLIGLAQTATTYSVVYGILGRNVAAEKRVWAMGIAAAAGSFGQFLLIPVEQGLITHFGATDALLLLGLMATFMLPIAFKLREPAGSGHLQLGNQTIAESLSEAIHNRSFQLLTLGYFVCGFQVVFISVHLAPYLSDLSKTVPSVGSPAIASTALALIGLFNVFGTFYAGVLGQRFPKRYLLSAIYACRAVAIALFVFMPITPLSTYVFAAVMGFLWLSTVPLTNAIVAQIFGVKYLSMLSGLVFFSHQLGSFCGAYLGGLLYDRSGTYDLVWMIAIVLGIFAALINLPIQERALGRLQST
jgi:predicted MFS family arabinose efflux permease